MVYLTIHQVVVCPLNAEPCSIEGCKSCQHYEFYNDVELECNARPNDN